MEKKFKITLPEQKIDMVLKEQKIKRMFGEDSEGKEGILSKIFIFVYLYGPLSITDLTDRLQKYYQLEYDRVSVFRAVDRLYKLNILNMMKGGDVLTIDESEKDENHKEVERLHRKFLDDIPQNFRSRYHNRNYVWFANGEGLKYLEWCCKLNKFNFETKNE